MALKAAMELIQTLSGHQDRVWGLAWSPSGETTGAVLCGQGHAVAATCSLML